MANIFKSSIGKKLIMSVSGLFLVLFLFVHATVNGLSLISDEAFQAGCDFMALPIVTIIVPILAFGFIIHIIYACILTIGNYKARGSIRYEVANKAQTDNWAAKNMFVLGIIILGFIAFHLTQFWARMQLQTFMGGTEASGPELLHYFFKPAWVLVLYLIWFAAIWFHLSHGFWSALQTMGLNNDIWIKRWKVIGLIVATLLVLVFAAVAIKAFLVANGYLGF
ncbi:MAG: succinate dehydrogenase cytochrome b subunit [Bacteroidales bacterium]|jgi:succinate dehydrogenase / fumarate reductase cytochrome b subunit|nr:succinate dehydrogenase cytochrome b subunit [Bacteroidales bacterium]